MLTIDAYAKVNLFLELTGKMSNGYHTVDTIMQSVSLNDTLLVELLPNEGVIIIECDTPGVPTDESNIAYKAAKAFFIDADLKLGAKIVIQKRIPFAAGLGGGSSDGAAALVALNYLCGEPLTEDQLCSIAAKLGADVPFFIKGGTWRLGGIGTDFKEKLEIPDCHIVIVKPNEGISTPDAYKILDELHCDFADHNPRKPQELLCEGKRKACKITTYCFNRFEEVLEALSPASLLILKYLRDISRTALLSGSGSALFAIAETESEAVRIKEKVIQKFPECFVAVTETTPVGVKIN